MNRDSIREGKLANWTWSGREQKEARMHEHKPGSVWDPWRQTETLALTTSNLHDEGVLLRQGHSPAPPSHINTWPQNHKSRRRRSVRAGPGMVQVLDEPQVQVSQQAEASRGGNDYESPHWPLELMAAASFCLPNHAHIFFLVKYNLLLFGEGHSDQHIYSLAMLILGEP